MNQLVNHMKYATNKYVLKQQMIRDDNEKNIRGLPEGAAKQI